MEGKTRSVKEVKEKEKTEVITESLKRFKDAMDEKITDFC
jgi:hypothetical protein